MSRPGSIDFFPGFDEPKPPREPAPVHKCEECGKPASFGFRSPGWHGLKEPCRWRCFAHRIENDAERGD